MSALYTPHMVDATTARPLSAAGSTASGTDTMTPAAPAVCSLSK